MLDIDKIYCGDCLDLIKQVADGSVDCICTDPPYLYLDTSNKNSSWDLQFDEDGLFEEWKRVLKPKGMIILFGRGESFYRWNTKLIQLGFPFKEEIIWYKKRPSTPLTPISRVHETVSILGEGSIRTSYFPSIENYDVDLEALERDIYRIKTTLNNPKHMQELLNYIQDGIVAKREQHQVFDITMPKKEKTYSHARHVSFYKHAEKVKEMSVIKVTESVMGRVHPTQKPIRLLERLLNLASDKGDVVLDCFMGSGTTGLACQNTGRHFIGFEKDETFCRVSKERVNSNRKLF